MICEFCTYDVKQNKQDEFEVLIQELIEYCRISERIDEVSCARKGTSGTLTYVLHITRKEEGPDVISQVHEKYGRRFTRCLDGEPRVIVGSMIA